MVWLKADAIVLKNVVCEARFAKCLLLLSPRNLSLLA
jgi:hypothetical protein